MTLALVIFRIEEKRTILEERPLALDLTIHCTLGPCLSFQGKAWLFSSGPRQMYWRGARYSPCHCIGEGTEGDTPQPLCTRAVRLPYQPGCLLVKSQTPNAIEQTWKKRKTGFPFHRSARAFELGAQQPGVGMLSPPPF